MQRLLFSRAALRACASSREGKQPNKDELQRIKRVCGGDRASRKLFLDDTPGITINELRAKARRRKRDDNIGFIAIDYLQFMQSRTKQAENSREREIGEISAGIKGLAKELDIPILVLAQLNRGPEGRTGKSLGVPRMSDLRESGTIEQDADMVGLLYRTAYYAEAEEEQEAGEPARRSWSSPRTATARPAHVPLTFIAELMRFEGPRPRPGSRQRHGPMRGGRPLSALGRDAVPGVRNLGPRGHGPSSLTPPPRARFPPSRRAPGGNRRHDRSCGPAARWPRAGIPSPTPAA